MFNHSICNSEGLALHLVIYWASYSLIWYWFPALFGSGVLFLFAFLVCFLYWSPCLFFLFFILIFILILILIFSLSFFFSLNTEHQKIWFSIVAAYDNENNLQNFTTPISEIHMWQWDIFLRYYCCWFYY